MKTKRTFFFIVLVTVLAGIVLVLLAREPRYQGRSLASGEGLVVLSEGVFIYLICRFAPSAKTGLLLASPFRCLLASLAGNARSVAVFPILLALSDHFAPI